MGLIGSLVRKVGLDIPAREYLPVGLRPEGLDVRVTLDAGREALDVSTACTVASLRPLLFAIVLARGEPGFANGRLEFREPGRASLGEIRLHGVRRVGADRALMLYEATSYRDRTVSRVLFELAQLRFASRQLRRSASRDPFQLARRPRGTLMVFYIRPRPVVLVSVVHAGLRNMFPMDLVCPVPDGRFLMALRSSSPSVISMRESRRFAMAEIPPSYKEYAYELAINHKRVGARDFSLPFPLAPSPSWGIPLPAEAVRVREVEVESVDVIGSHHLFTTRIVNDEERAGGPRLCHISALFGRRLVREGRSPPGL